MNAQSAFHYKAKLDEIKQTGFYKITLVPQIAAKCKQDFSDIRIEDEQKKFIPYILKSDLPVFSSSNFIEFPILFNEKLKDSSSELVIENKAQKSISSLLLIIKNNSAYRTAILSGSDDQQKWFVIKENILLEEANSNTKDEFLQAVSFPLSNYHFFKIIINDKGMLPLNILKAGIYSNRFTYGEYLPIPDPLIRQKDSSNKHTYIQLAFNDYYEVDRLNIYVKGPALYKRSVLISDTINANYHELAEIQLTPKNIFFTIQSAKTNCLLFDIDNKDDQPLVIEKVNAFQINKYMLAYLEAGKNYSLLAGDSSATLPEYDLKYFADTLSNNAQEITPGHLEKMNLLIAPVVTAKKSSTTLLWIIISAVLLLLITLSFNMIKSISQRDE